MAGERAPTNQQVFPFDVEYQKSLLKILCEDSRFAHLVAEHLEPRFFENEVLSWAWSFALRFHREYGAIPTMGTLFQQTRQLDPKLRPIYELTLEQVRSGELRDEAWLRDSVLDFIKRNIFVRSFHESRELYNKNAIEKAYDHMMTGMERISKTVWAVVDESWFFDDLPDRQVRHMAGDSRLSAVCTGFSQLDHLMNGGLSPGELGIWVAYSKGGKSIMLIQHGISATRSQLRPTAHFVFEGSKTQVEDRYEAAWTGDLYNSIRTGGLGSEAYRRAYQEYQMAKGKLVIRGFTDEWNYSCADILTALKDWKRTRNFVPDLVIVDYGDLLNGRAGHYSSEQAKQKDAFRDLKSLANRGYAVWTASQAHRPSEGSENFAHWIWARDIADCYEKVRVADFLGSLNSCLAERKENILRILAELYRDNEANKRFCVRTNLAKMEIREDPSAVSSSMRDLESNPKLGVVRQQQKTEASAPSVASQPVQTTAALKMS